VLTWIMLFYTLGIALLMVSRLPVFSGKRVGTRVPSEMVGPVILLVILTVALLIAYPWVLLTAATLAYLVSLPLGYLSYRRYEQRSREPKPEVAAVGGSQSAQATGGAFRSSSNDDRPSRLN
jgi:CDP-diacylglycerol--serine O-phosphatidyltransferase